MARDDLLALDDDALAQLANPGLVKRAARDLAEGRGPRLAESGDALEALFPDGVRTRLAPGQALMQATCDCVARGLCRHRVALALAYRAQVAAEKADAPQASRHAPAQAEAWDPGALDASALEARLPRGERALLGRLRADGVEAELTFGPPPAVAFPMASVRFLVPGDIAYARCDCAAGGGCAHVVMAVEAFRRSAPAEPARAAAARDDLTEAADAVLARLLADGVVAGLAAHGGPIDAARRAARGKRAVWIELALDALEAQIAAFERRSAAYDEDETLALAVELHARPRAAGFAAGFGEARETAMAKTRLVSLGARVFAQGKDARALVAFAALDTGATMLAERVVAAGEAQARVVAGDLADRTFAHGRSLRALANGELLTLAARRRADGKVLFADGARGRGTLMARPTLIAPSAPLRAAGADAVRARLLARPPTFLRARDGAADLHVFDVADALDQRIEPGAQRWRAAVKLAEGGGALLLSRRYDPAAPAAFDALSATLSGRHGPLRQICGRVSLEDGDLICDPWGLSADRWIAPDLEEASGGARPPAAATQEPDDPVAALRRHLAGALHLGAARLDAQRRDAAREAAREARAAGYAVAAERVERWLAAPGDERLFGAAALWLATLSQDNDENDDESDDEAAADDDAPAPPA